jgi:FkbM family methyltransferase
MSDQSDVITLELVDGTKVIVPDSLENITSYVLREQADWFEDDIKFLRQLVQPGETVVDIGANHGVYALTLARQVGPSGQLWAYEPASDTAQLLTASAVINGTTWLHVLQQGLSDREGSAWLQTPGQSELNSLADRAGDRAPTGPGEAVSVTTLDHCLDRHGWTSVDLLKIDAEGEEERILKGGARFFKELSPLVMFEVKAGAELHLELVERFAELGYQCFRLIPGLNLLAPFAIDQSVDGFLLNLYAAKPDRVALLAAAGWLIDENQPVAISDDNDPGSDTWLKPLQQLSYARTLVAGWQRPSRNQEQPLIKRALAFWSDSQDADLSVGRRYSALRQSHQLLQYQCQPGSPVVSWASLARVALACGERVQAVRVLRAMLAELHAGHRFDFEEPFLCPHPDFETIEPVGSMQAWLEAAVLYALEHLASYSGFYASELALSWLERVSALGYNPEATTRRIALINERLTVSPRAGYSSSSVAEWFNFLGLKEPIRCIDVGALGLGDEPEPWVGWADQGCAAVLGFEPLQDACEQLNQQAQSGSAIRYLPLALGDGAEHTLYITNVPMTSSLFSPARTTVDLFPALGELMHVEKQVRTATHRLDDIPEAATPDFLKLDVQGAELMILQNAVKCLRSVSVIQCEVEFLELYEGQPLMADVDAFLRSQGFCFLRFAYMMGRPFKPLLKDGKPDKAISQTLWADAIYVRDFRLVHQWSSRQLQAAAFILHELYQATDLTALLLREFDQRSNSRLSDCYLAALMTSQLL